MKLPALRSREHPQSKQPNLLPIHATGLSEVVLGASPHLVRRDQLRVGPLGCTRAEFAPLACRFTYCQLLDVTASDVSHSMLYPFRIYTLCF